VSINNLTIAELEVLLMQETKKLTTSIREGSSAYDKENQRSIIEAIQKLLNEKRMAASS